MAYDKVVDSNVLNNNLKSVADAIREKAGLEESFTFPAGFVEAIAGIETGGGGVLMAGGTVTPAEKTNELVLFHNLSAVPQFIFVSVASASMRTKGSIASVIITPKKGDLTSEVSLMIGTTQTQAYYQTYSYYRVMFNSVSNTPTEDIVQTKAPYYTATNTEVRIYGTNYYGYTNYSEFDVQTYYWIAVYNPNIETWEDFA